MAELTWQTSVHQGKWITVEDQARGSLQRKLQSISNGRYL